MMIKAGQILSFDKELENKRKNHLIVKLIQAISLLLVIETVISWFV